MADFSHLRKKNRLGAPPPEHEIKNNLQRPESYDSAAPIDGRTLRKTGRTHQLATRVRPEFYKQIKIMAAHEGITIAELIEKAVEAYARGRSK